MLGGSDPPALGLPTAMFVSTTHAREFGNSVELHSLLTDLISMIYILHYDYDIFHKQTTTLREYLPIFAMINVSTYDPTKKGGNFKCLTFSLAV